MPQDGSISQNVVNSASAAETPLSIEGAQFLRDFIAKTEQFLKSKIDPGKVARFRLSQLSSANRATMTVHSIHVTLT